MRSRATLMLMELLVMVLVFALAAAVCLRCFVLADGIGRETAQRDRAVLLAQNGAEAVKAVSGDLEAAALLLGGQVSEGVLTVSANEDLILEIYPQHTDIPGLGQARVEARWEDQVLICLTAAWQEVLP